MNINDAWYFFSGAACGACFMALAILVNMMFRGETQ